MIDPNCRVHYKDHSSGLRLDLQIDEQIVK